MSNVVTYITADGDTLDYIAWQHYGDNASRQLERVLAMNSGLAIQGPVYPAGLAIKLPVLDAEPVIGVRLWS